MILGLEQMYDPVGQLTQRHYANGAVTSQTFDGARNLTGILNLGAGGSTVSSLSYGYNQANQRTHQIEDDGTVTSWT
jgi:YD repeat-containing protein